MYSIKLKKKRGGSAWLAQWEVCDSRSQGCEFKPYVGCKDYLKIKSFRNKQTKNIVVSQQSFQNKKSKKSYRRGHSDQPTSQDNIFKKLDQRSLCASITQLGSCQGNGEPQAKTAATAPR